MTNCTGRAVAREEEEQMQNTKLPEEPCFAGKYPSLPGSTPIGREVPQFDGKYVSLARRKQAQQEAQPRVHKMKQNNNQLCVGKLQPATRQ